MLYLSENLIFDVKEIDDEHIELCIRANKLFQALIDGNIISEVKTCVEYFEKYIEHHFQSEENLQKKLDYPFYLEHKEKHENFKEVMYNLKAEMKNKGITYEFIRKFNYTIIDWLTHHLNVEDFKLAQFIKEKQKVLQ